MGKHNAYPPEVEDFVRENAPLHTFVELAELTSKKFGRDMSLSQMRAYCSNRHIHIGKRAPGKRTVWPIELDSIMEEIVPGHSYQEISDILKERTGRTYTPDQINAYIGNHKLNTGKTGYFEKGQEAFNKGKKWDEFMSKEAQEGSRRTCFKKGNIPPNNVPVGTIRITKDGYQIIKVQDTGPQWARWKLVQRKVWEEHNGPIPDGHLVIFKDGDKMNCDIDNLALITLGENAVLNRRGYRESKNQELTDVAIATVRLERAVKEKRKERKHGTRENRRQGRARPKE